MTEFNEIDEIVELKLKADRLGIKYHPSIGAPKLREKIAAALEPVPETKTVEVDKNALLRREANKLIRVRITCMNPHKSKYPGQLFSVSNKVIGRISKFIPFNASEGYHIPAALLTVLEDKHYLENYEVKLPNGKTAMRKKLIKEFSIEKLPPLTEKELRIIAERQKANGTIGVN